MSLRLPCAARFAVAAAISCLPAAAQTHYDLTVLPPAEGHASAFPTALGAQGMVLGHAGSEVFDPLAVPVLNLGRRQTWALPQPTDSLNFALGAAGAELIVGSSSNFPVAWVSQVPLPLPPVAGLVQGTAFDANGAGAICGTLFNDFTGAQLPVLWPSALTPGTALPLGGGVGGTALALAENGRIAGAVLGAGLPFQGARWDGAGSAPLLVGVPEGALNSELRAIDLAGNCAGRAGYADGSVRALWVAADAPQPVLLGSLGGGYSEALGIASGPRVVGVASDGSGTLRAFLFEQGAMTDLQSRVLTSTAPFLGLARAVGIDEAGRIAVEVRVAAPGGEATRLGLLRPRP